MSLKPNPDTEPGIREPAPLPSSWNGTACKAAFEAFDDPRFAAATAVAGSANRLIQSAGGPGFVAAALAREIGDIEQSIGAVSQASAAISPDLSDAASQGFRLVFSGRYEVNRVVAALARQWNLRQAPGRARAAVAVHAVDIEDGVWNLSADDVLIDVDVRDRCPDARGFRPQRDRTPRPRRFWTYTRQPTTSPGHIKVPGNSAALAAIVVFTSLSHLLRGITPTTHRSA
ncbi:hypothetical protein BH23CHL2_BH23CHL2_29340 [soil metagenome]